MTVEGQSAFTIRSATSGSDIEVAAALFREYAASLPITLDYQGFESELAALPGKYAPPDGELLLGIGSAGEALGCVALRRFDPTRSEMKRLFVRPAGRGTGLGRTLAEMIVAAARSRGYGQMLLDTLPSMTSAVALYQSLGFRRIAPYYDTPIEGTIFMGLAL